MTQLTELQLDAINKLAKDGWNLTQHYGDGIVRMAKHFGHVQAEDDVLIGVFIRKDGALGLPHTHATQAVQAHLNELGFKFKHGKEFPVFDNEVLIGIPPEHMEDEDRDAYVAWLEETLIPDLRESGYEATADDFDKCIRLIRELTLQRDGARRDVADDGVDVN